MIKIQLIDKKNFPYNRLYDFLTLINDDFPVHLDKKTSFNSFLKKIEQFGEVICAFDEDKIVGCIFFYANNVEEKIAFITLFGVLKEYRRLHIATMLLKEMIQYCCNNYKKIHLYTHSTNYNAIHFYKKNNFHSIQCDRANDLKLELDLEEVCV